MANFIVIVISVLIVGLAIGYIRREKKRGVACIGCPDSAKCGGSCSGCCGSCSGCPGKKQSGNPM